MAEDIKNLFKDLIFANSSRKIAALIAAIVLWFVVNNSITTTRTFTNVPIRVFELPEDKTIEGLLSNNLLSKRITLTLTGKKTVLDKIDTTDLEVHIDATGKIETWVAELSKRNLVSLDPDIDIRSGITSISHNNFLIKMTPLISSKIPVTVIRPRGEPPRGYQYLDIWPQYFEHTVSGPKEEVEALREQGIELSLNLSKIRQEDLANLPASDFSLHQDEISFPVPLSWTKIAIPFQQARSEEINDPAAKTLHIDFLKKSLLPLEKSLPIRVYYPPRYNETINPLTYILKKSNLVEEKNALYFFNQKVYMRNVSRLFLDVVENNMELTIKAVPKSKQDKLSWSIEYINPLQLENKYLELLKVSTDDPSLTPLQRQEFFRARFREYMRLGTLYDENDQPVQLEIELTPEGIAFDLTEKLPPKPTRP